MKRRNIFIMLALLLTIAVGDTYLNFTFNQKSVVADVASAQPCTTAKLKTQIVYHSSSQIGLTRYDIIASNTGASACTIDGAPMLVYSSADNKAISKPIAILNTPKQTLTIGNNQSAIAELSTYITSDAVGTMKPLECISDIHHIRLSMPGDTRYRLMDSPFTVSCMATTVTKFGN